MKTNEEVGKEVLAELRERAQQPESDKVTAPPQHFFVPSLRKKEKSTNQKKYKKLRNRHGSKTTTCEGSERFTSFPSIMAKYFRGSGTNNKVAHVLALFW
jgi:hypothetical protein